MFKLLKEKNKKIIENMIEPIEVGQIEKVEEDLHNYVMEEHKKLSEELGTHPIAELKENEKKFSIEKANSVYQFKSFLTENDIKIYNYTKVKKFLTRLYGKKGYEGGWCWTKLIGAQDDCYNDLSKWQSGYINNRIIYRREIPLRTLQLVKKIKIKFLQTNYFVSEVAVSRPDPFLMVYYLDEGYVIDHWDEPSFKD